MRGTPAKAELGFAGASALPLAWKGVQKLAGRALPVAARAAGFVPGPVGLIGKGAQLGLGLLGAGRIAEGIKRSGEGRTGTGFWGHPATETAIGALDVGLSPLGLGTGAATLGGGLWRRLRGTGGAAAGRTPLQLTSGRTPLQPSELSGSSRAVPRTEGGGIPMPGQTPRSPGGGLYTEGSGPQRFLPLPRERMLIGPDAALTYNHPLLDPNRVETIQGARRGLEELGIALPKGRLTDIMLGPARRDIARQRRGRLTSGTTSERMENARIRREQRATDAQERLDAIRRAPFVRGLQPGDPLAQTTRLSPIRPIPTPTPTPVPTPTPTPVPTPTPTPVPTDGVYR
jgi:hypothetical protein